MRDIMQNIIVFGTGKYFEYKKESMEKKYNIVYFLDNKVEAGSFALYQNTEIKIFNPMDIDRKDNTVIFLMSVHFISMWKQLCEIGIAPERIVFPYDEAPFFENDDALCHCLKEIRFSMGYVECIRKSQEAVRISNEAGWRTFLRSAYRDRYPLINAVAQMETEPISRQFGTERGAPIDRHYIEVMLADHSDYIRGDVLEIEDNTYTMQFGGDKVQQSIVMDVSSTDSNVSFNGNIETGQGIRDEIADCFILTQTLMYIYDLGSAAHNIMRLLKKGGTALITCSGISQNSRRCMDNYGCYFNFNADVFVRMFEKESNAQVLETGSFGNVKTVSAHLNGLCSEDLVEEDFVPNDKYYPLIVYAVVKKNG